MPNIRKILQILQIQKWFCVVFVVPREASHSAAARQEAGFMAEMSPHRVQISVASQQPHTSTDLAAVAAALTLAAGVWWSSPSEAQASA